MEACSKSINYGFLKPGLPGFTITVFNMLIVLLIDANQFSGLTFEGMFVLSNRALQMLYLLTVCFRVFVLLIKRNGSIKRMGLIVPFRVNDTINI